MHTLLKKSEVKRSDLKEEREGLHGAIAKGLHGRGVRERGGNCENSESSWRIVLIVCVLAWDGQWNIIDKASGDHLAATWRRVARKETNLNSAITFVSSPTTASFVYRKLCCSFSLVLEEGFFCANKQRKLRRVNEIMCTDLNVKRLKHLFAYVWLKEKTSVCGEVYPFAFRAREELCVHTFVIFSRCFEGS